MKSAALTLVLLAGGFLDCTSGKPIDNPLVHFGSVGCDPPESHTLPDFVPMPQEASEWCWAASAQMAVNYQGAGKLQCEVANAKLKRSCPCSVCENGGQIEGRQCNKRAWPAFGPLGFTTEPRRTGALSFEEIKNEIFCGNRPILFTWSWENSDDLHMLVLFGYGQLDGEPRLYVADPAGGGAPCAPYRAHEISYRYYTGECDEEHSGCEHNIDKNIFGIRHKS